MSRTRSLCAPFAAVLVVAACAEEPATAVVMESLGPPADLEFFLPAVDPDRLVAREPAAAPLPSRPTLVVEPGESGESDEPGASGVPVHYFEARGAIAAARTVVGFEAVYAYSRGQHTYLGNKGRVESSVTVTFRGRPLGTQSAFKEDYGIFLFDGGRSKFIWASARVYSDHECGLEVSGESKHSAWWEFFTGVGVLTWGKVERSTSAPSAAQDACEPVNEERPSGGDGEDEDGYGVVCWYLLEYNIFTGEIYYVELLYCGSVG